jgi:O-antigen/teichoic acid export membrane protein
MEHQSGTTPASDANAPDKKYSLATRLLHHTRSGLFFYWSSFFYLVLIEFLLGGELSKILSHENYSIYVNVLNTLPFYNVLANIGISYSILYILSYNKEIKFSFFRQTLQLQFLWYAVLVGIHVGLFLFFENIYFRGLLITIIISYVYSFRLNMTSFFLAGRAYNKAAVSNMLQKTGLLLAILVIHFSPWLKQLLNSNFPELYAPLELSMVLLYLAVFFKTNYRSFIAPGISYTKRILNYGKYAMVNNGLNVLYYMILALIIRTSGIGLHMQIILGLCIMFFRYTAVAVTPIFSTMNPQLTLIKDDMPGVKKMYKKYFRLTLLLGACTLLACRFLFKYVIGYFYNVSYHDLPPYFNFFAYLIPLLFINSLNSSVMAAVGKIKFTAIAEIVCTLLLVAFFIYNLVSPVGTYYVFYYFVFIHIVVKFLVLSAGTYKALN